MYGEQNTETGSEWMWETVTPESRGFHSGDLERMVEHIEENDLSIHSIIIYKDDAVPFEIYFEPYNKDVSHNLKSTSKGVISALVGIAIREGYIEGLDEKVLSFFPEYGVKDEDKSNITIRDLLTMSSGLKWNENGLNSMYTFFVSKKIVKRVLKLSLIDEPGSTFNYNTGLTHLLSAIITKASGMSTLEFAEKYLFGPLDIRNVQWSTDRDGYYIGGSELFLTPRAMTKFGVMYLNRGMYGRRQIVPQEWVAESTVTQMEGTFHGADIKYGYLWWLDIGNPLFSYIDDENDFTAMGVHGQRIFISRTHDMVVVITADQGDESECDKLIRDFIVPSLSQG
jgi:CubicO group peptidase (beta-lactamase class C family)